MRHTMFNSAACSKSTPAPFRAAGRSATSRNVVCAANTETSRRSMLAGLALGWMVSSGADSASATPFLQATGAKGVLVEEEAALYNLRKEKEEEARQQLDQFRKELEPQGRATVDGKLCATPFGIDVVGITEALALIGALVGGVTARQRKDELERLNEQLRKINLSLRQQARSGTVYAPGLTYAPTVRAPKPSVPTPESNGTAPAVVAAVVTAPAKPAPVPANHTSSTLLSMEEDEMSPDQLSCRDALRAGKKLLKDQNGSAAMVRFEKALMLSKALGDKVQERRAVRGLAAAARLQGQFKMSIRNLERVLVISKEIGEYTGDADAYGTIADCYTDLGEFEKAALYYDKYIERMNKGPL